MLKRARSFLESLLLKERSVQKLSASFCLGTFIALTPTIPLQTPLAMALAWLLGWNVGVAVAALYIINNPITLLPIYATGYALGSWFFTRVFGIDLLRYNPWWVERLNAFLSQYVDIKNYSGTELCLWYLLGGGMLLATIISVPLYPLLTRILSRLALQLDKQKVAK